MITRHHLVLVLMSALILGMAVFPSDIPALGALVAGSCIGAVLPDIHMTRPKRPCLRSIAWRITRSSACTCIPALCAPCFTVFRLNLCPSDKRLTHSLPGIALIGGMVAGFTAVPVILLGLFPVPLPLAAFAGGVIAGLVLHLTEDVCTRKGITPFYPFSAVRIAGSIRPCDRTDPRIARYHLHHCSTAVIVCILHLGWAGPAAASVIISLLAISACCGTMVWSSDVRIDAGGSARPGNFRPPSVQRSP